MQDVRERAARAFEDAHRDVRQFMYVIYFREG